MILRGLLANTQFVVLLLASALMAQQPIGSMQPAPPSRPSISQTSPEANAPGNTPVRVDDKKFVKDAALGGLTEVKLGQLAATKGSSDAVKRFGQKMVDDHTKANSQLKEAASKAGYEIPEALDSKHQARIDKLEKLNGAEFDKAYIKDQVKDHEADVRAFQDEVQNGSNTAVKTFASEALPVVREHLSLAKDLRKPVGTPSGV